MKYLLIAFSFLSFSICTGQKTDSTAQSTLSIYQTTELNKIKTLADSGAITSDEYSILKHKILTNSYDYTNNPADQIVKLKLWLTQHQITQQEFSEKKAGVINGSLHITDKPVVQLFQKIISVSTDLAQYALKQPNINIEYKWNGIAIGIYGGLILPDNMFAVNPVAKGQYTLPGTVYTGEAFKLYFKYYSVNHPNTYWCAQLIAKPEWFNNVSFSDEAVPDEVSVNYTMNEKTIVWGIDLLHGHQLIKGPLDIDFFYGLGFHDRARNYVVTSQSYSGGYGGRTYNPEVGTYNTSAFYPTPVIGLKIGINYLTNK